MAAFLALIGLLGAAAQATTPPQSLAISVQPMSAAAAAADHNTSAAASSAAGTPTSSPAATSADWPQYRHDGQRSGRAGASLPVSGSSALHLQWAYSLGERVEVEVEPIVADGKLFVGAMNGTLTALNTSDGSVAWSFSQSGPIAHSAAYDSGQVFFGSLDGYVYALNASSGALAWKVDTGGPVYAAPTVSGGVVYIGSTAGRFFALDASSGAEKWHYPAGTTRLSSAFTGAAAVSPDGASIFVGNEDLIARALNASSGALLWQHQLTGVGMRGTYPVVSDDGATVIFVSSKPGIQSYVPTENYPGVSAGNNPASTWNSYYQTYPDRRSTFFLNASTGAERWDTSSQSFVPLPLPYWGLLEPTLDQSGNAWFATPGGASGSDFGPYSLDHDTRLLRVSLSSGAATQVASRSEFQLRTDENGRATMAGNDYLYTVSEDMGVYHTSSNTKAELFGNGFSSHMDPLAPLPSKHVWRYGGVIAMGGVPAASPPVVVGDRVYYISYGWLFALGATDKSLDPSGTKPIAFTSRDTRDEVLTNPRSDSPTVSELQSELDQRVLDMINAGDQAPFAKFDQAGAQMDDEISGFQIFGMPGERIWILSQTLPYLSSSTKAKALTYLKQLAQEELFDSSQYAYRRDCLIYGVSGVQTGDACSASDKIVAAWFADNELLVADRLYAMAAYSEASGDWSLVNANWSLIKTQFAKFTSAYNSTLGFCVFQKWHVGKLGIANQIGAAAGVLRLATHYGDSDTATQAQTLLNNLLSTRVKLAHYVRDQYDSGAISDLPMDIDADGVPNNKDVFAYNDGGELIPLDGDRDRDSDTRQVNWYDGSTVHLHSGAGFMYYAALVGYNPLYSELATYLKSQLLSETRQYVQTYEVNAPWWWMGDLSHHTTDGGEFLWHSPSLAHDLFQTKALVLDESWDELLHELPEPMSINPRYDPYRMHNLATLLSLSDPDLSTSLLSASPLTPKQNESTRISFALRNIGGPLEQTATLTITLPSELSAVPDTDTADLGSTTLGDRTLVWQGTPASVSEVVIGFDALNASSEVRTVKVSAQLSIPGSSVQSFTLNVILNGHSIALPMIQSATT